MRHIVISDYGYFLGVRHGLLLVQGPDKTKRTYPLNRLRSLSIAKRGVSLSSDLVETLSMRGIKLFFLGFKGTAQSTLIGNVQHGVVANRINQYQFCSGETFSLACSIIEAKIKNQRGVLSYFGKYHKSSFLLNAAESLKKNALGAKQSKSWESLLGFEGSSARSYFTALRDSDLFSSSFKKREGRGSSEINNTLLNFGYAILSTYILGAVENAGLEPHLGIIHSIRPGKMSLVLDLMEEYRAWVVDRAVIKMRFQSENQESLTADLKKNLIENIQRTCSKKYLYRQKMVRLEHIIQRQVYRLSGHFHSEKSYRPYLFKW